MTVGYERQGVGDIVQATLRVGPGEIFVDLEAGSVVPDGIGGEGVLNQVPGVGKEGL